MRSSSRLAGLALLLIGVESGSLATAAGQHDLAAVNLRVRRAVKLTDQQVTTIARAALRVQNRGSQPVTFPDAATFDAAVQLSAAAAAGPIVCPPVGIARRELSTPCTGDPAHIDALRQNQIGKQVALAFFEAFLRSDSAADAYLTGELAITNTDLTHQFVR